MRQRAGGRPKAKRSLGQNFLYDPGYVAKVIAAVGPVPEDIVVEIGPGRGALTEKLVDSGAAVIAIELDRDLIEPLRTTFGDRGNFRVVEQDALTVDFAALIPNSQPAKLVANLPYYISTAILQHLAGQRDHFSSMVLMFQREVVDRISAKPGTSDRGYLTVISEIAFHVEKLFDVPPAAFRPVPKVWSSVVRLSPKRKVESEERLKRLASAAFGQKRKTIANNLKHFFPGYAAMLSEAGIDGNRRAESLSLEEWLRLSLAADETKS